MIGSLIVYGNQQWRSEGLHKADWNELQFLYHCMAMVKNAEAEAAKAEQQKAQSQAQADHALRERFFQQRP